MAQYIQGMDVRASLMCHLTRTEGSNQEFDNCNLSNVPVEVGGKFSSISQAVTLPPMIAWFGCSQCSSVTLYLTGKWLTWNESAPFVHDKKMLQNVVIRIQNAQRVMIVVQDLAKWVPV